MAAGVLGGATARPAARRLDRLGLLMKSVPATLASDMPGTLQRIASIGYREVEFWTPEGVSIAALEIRRLMDRLSLMAPSRHVRMADVFSRWRVLLNECRILGNRHVVCEEIPQQERATMGGYARVADLVNAAGKITQWAGIQLVVRPHEDDFRPRDGVVPFDYLMSRTDPLLVKFQMDLSMTVRVNREPLADLSRYPGRFASVHVNDLDPAAPGRPVGLGEGRLDLAAIVGAASRAGVQYYFVDDRRPELSWEHATANFAYLSGLEIA